MSDGSGSGSEKDSAPPKAEVASEPNASVLEDDDSRKRRRSDDDDDADEEEEKEKTPPHSIKPGVELEGTNLVFKTEALNEHLICSLCMGYFRDAQSIVECLHTFCRVCIHQHIAINKCCPVCDVELGPAPLEKLRNDRVLQTIVDKVFPQFAREDLISEHEFWKELGVEPPQELLPIPPPIEQPQLTTTLSKAPKPEIKMAERKQDRTDPSGAAATTSPTPTVHKKPKKELKSPSATPSKPESGMVVEKKKPGRPPKERNNDAQTTKSNLSPTPYIPMSDEVLDFQVTQDIEGLQNVNALPNLAKPFMRSASKLTVSQLKKFLFLKLKLPHPMDKVAFHCRGSELNLELSLFDVRRLFWNDKEIPLHIKYRPLP